MDRNLAGLIGAVSALGAALPSHAMPAHDPMVVSSYADLLKPIPNALALLRASEAAKAEAPVLTVQYWYHHHHHHHHNFFRPRYYPPRYHHHHHHHWHHHHHHHWYRGEGF